MNKNKLDDLKDLTLEELMKKVKEQKTEEKRVQMEIERQKKEAIEILSANKLKQEAKEIFEKNTTREQPIKKENLVATLLKWASICLFLLSLFGSGITANKEVIKEPTSPYNQELEIVEEFSLGLAIVYIGISAIVCSLMYAFGELIQLQDDNKHLLQEVVKNTSK